MFIQYVGNLGRRMSNSLKQILSIKTRKHIRERKNKIKDKLIEWMNNTARIGGYQMILELSNSVSEFTYYRDFDYKIREDECKDIDVFSTPTCDIMKLERFYGVDANDYVLFKEVLEEFKTDSKYKLTVEYHDIDNITISWEK